MSHLPVPFLVVECQRLLLGWGSFRLAVTDLFAVAPVVPRAAQVIVLHPWLMAHASPEFVTVRHVQQTYQISRSALRSWAEAGKVRVLRPAGTGKRLYHLGDVERHLGISTEQQQKEKERFSACYARVSSAKQHADLERQCAYLQQHYPEHRLYRDTGSGLNFKRPQFLSLLEQVHAGLVREIVVADKDRLCRFGWELVEWLLDKAGTRLVVHRPPDWASGGTDSDNADVNHELSDDIISVITFFTARHYGQRSARNRKRRRDPVAAPGQEAPLEQEQGKRRRRSPVSSADDSASGSGDEQASARSHAEDSLVSDA